MEPRNESEEQQNAVTRTASDASEAIERAQPIKLTKMH